MTLAEFIDEQQCRLAMFQDFWTIGNADNATDFPLEMESGEWDEQLQVFDQP